MKMLAILKLFIQRLFDIREGELQRALLMQLNIFILITVLLVVKPVSNSLFISELGIARLPSVFILVAIMASIFSVIYSRRLIRASLNTIIKWTLLISFFTLVFFGLLLRFNILEGSILYLFYAFVAIFGVLTASQFWILTNIVFNAREAKRLFGFIGGGAIAGGIFGGYLTNILAEGIGSENLLFVSAGMLLICVPINAYIWKNFVQKRQTDLMQKKRLKRPSARSLPLILQSKHLTYLAALTLISVIVAKLVEYQFSAIASKNIPDTDELTAFFGFWFSTLNLISLFIQLVLTRHVVGIFGVGTSLLFLPFGILFGAVAVLFFPQLWSAILLRVSDGSLKQSVNKAATELLALPISADIKSQTKTYIDVFVDSVATGIGGLILIFLVNGMEMPTRFISIFIILLIGVWLWIAYRIRYEYIKSIRLKFQEDTESDKLPKLELSKQSILSGLQTVLENGNEQQLISVLQKAQEIVEPRLVEAIKPLIHHPSSLVKKEAIEALYFYKGQHLLKEILPFTNHPDQGVKIAAFEYLIEHDLNGIDNVIANYLNDEDYEVRGAAFLGIAKETKDNPSLKSKYELEKILRSEIDRLAEIKDESQLKFTKINIAKVICYLKLEDLYGKLDEFLAEENTEVIRGTIEALSYNLDKRFIPVLLNYLESSLYREDAKSALINYGSGALPEIIKELEKRQSLDLARSVPEIFEKMPFQSVLDQLFDLFDYEDTIVRLEATRVLSRMSIRYPHLKFNNKKVVAGILKESRLYLDSLTALYLQQKNLNSKEVDSIKLARKRLIDILERRLNNKLELIFKLLGLKYSPEDMDTIYNNLRDPESEHRADSIEFLDNLLDHTLKKVLIPIVESSNFDTISESMIRKLRDDDVPDQYDCLKLLLDGKDIKIKLSVLLLIHELKDANYLPLIESLLSHKNRYIVNQAKKTQESLAA